MVQMIMNGLILMLPVILAAQCKMQSQTSNKSSANAQMLDNITEPVTPATNPELWYRYYEIVKQDAPEILDTFIENTAAKMELTVDYFVQEFL
tara:strand:- start:896 stop:1174 length:279 start_codon:yes stop_codon:yes gene_type:complete